MRTLLILSCAQDIMLTRRLFLRIERLGGWRYFSYLHLHLDSDVPERDVETVLSALSVPQIQVHVTRSNEPGCWRSKQAETMLAVYQMACAFDSDIVRLDPDVFIPSEEFFEHLAVPYDGIAGKLMLLSPPAVISGRQLDFIQGGVSCWGPHGRSFLRNLSVSTVKNFKENYRTWVQIFRSEASSQYDYYFRCTEDVVLTGPLAILAGVERKNIPNIQVSPYDVLQEHRSDRWNYEDYITAFKKSGALAYHFEGNHSGKKIKMTQMLQTYYLEQE